jgi:hypothetical protein
MEILDECGCLATGGAIQLVNFCDFPDGLSAPETENYLRENGAGLCRPRYVP